MEKQHRHAAIEGLVEFASLGSDVAPAARRALHSIAGPTVPRALAARVLRVTPSALRHWVAAGTLPVVLTPTGRHEIPVSVLVRVAAAGRREVGSRARVLRSVTASAQRPGHRAAPTRRDPSRHGDVGLAYHIAVAERLTPELVDEARERLVRWRDQGTSLGRVGRAWDDLLEQPLATIRERLVANDDAAAFLRQGSAFAGALTAGERATVLAAVAAGRPG